MGNYQFLGSPQGSHQGGANCLYHVRQNAIEYNFVFGSVGFPEVLDSLTTTAFACRGTDWIDTPRPVRVASGTASKERGFLALRLVVALSNRSQKK
ncbi:hypothetical protein [Moorena sp. SIO4G3]|uniref:hypothetical protein n=1 Tax=Moorena sp. SIO4G3 TaxID=2607821 RepID=UPI00142BB45D|nr:hypothetical protein [Moorena sp. SIO4G3]NEO75208.1 hypothetical protein [Moorena sp. SIO4G3]